MKTFFRSLWAVAFAASLAAEPAFAGSGTLAVTPGSGATFHVGTDGSSNLFSVLGICDGSACANLAAVKGASTAAAATDPALVVSVSPNNTPVLPSGAATAANQTNVQGTAGSPSTAVLTVQGVAGGTAQNVSGTVGAASSPILGNPTSTLTLTSATTAYTAGQLIANNATAGSIVVPSFAIANSAGGAGLPRLRLSNNDATSTAWGGVSIQIDLWTAAPTFANGDRATWSIATGTASHIAAYTCILSAEYGDGVYGECSPNIPISPWVKLASGTSIYWTAEAVTASGVTGASKVFTLTAEVLN